MLMKVEHMQVVQAPSPILRETLKPVKKINPGHLSTLKEMVKLTKTFKDPEGVGLAANQVGLHERFFIAKDGEIFIPVFNPEILFKYKKTKIYLEGCLSIPNYYGEVKRHLSIKVTYQDETGKKFTKILKGVLAWIFQHEIDHLNGHLFPERVMEQKGKFYKVTGKDEAGTDIFEEVTI